MEDPFYGGSMLRLSLFSFLLAGTAAFADGLPARNGDEVRLNVNQKSKKALRLRPAGEGWRLELGVTNANGVADVFDVTPGTPARTMAVNVNGGSILFDRVRFAGGHAYRVQLHSDGKATASGFVFLVPDPPAKEAPRRGAERLRFETDDKPVGDDKIQPVEKAPL
jgi:hypothetical protein